MLQCKSPVMTPLRHLNSSANALMGFAVSGTVSQIRRIEVAMWHRKFTRVALAFGVMAPGNLHAKGACDAAQLSALPGVRLVSASEESVPVPHCKIAGVIGTETNFELLLPKTWNRKFVMGGGGGFVGFVVNTALLYGALQKGYATVGTDTGHRGHPLDASWALNNLERVVSFGHQAVHRTAVTTKALTATYYGQDISRSYFTGCSRGGGQALMEAQRYPEDFDGIVAGAPAHNWTVGIGARNTRLNQAMYPKPTDLSVAVIGPEAQRLIGEAVMERCDALDGLRDSVLNDPMKCDFDVSSLSCNDGTTNACLSEKEVNAANTIYDDLYISGARVFPGFPVGGELSPGGWTKWMTGGLDVLRGLDFQEGAGEGAAGDPAPVTPSFHFAFGNGVMKYFVFHDPDWNYADYSFEKFWADVATVAPTLNATDPDLSAFRNRGGKLLIYTGWADMALSPYGTIAYYESVLKHDQGAAEDVRLIMMPGVDHCFGGAGPDFVNYLDVIDNWIKTGVAPDRVTAFWLNDQFQPDGSRPVCAYPKVVTYNGSGDPRDAASFSCAE